jgi:hypothetical protein
MQPHHIWYPIRDGTVDVSETDFERHVVQKIVIERYPTGSDVSYLQSYKMKNI